MASRFLLDTGFLGYVTHPKGNETSHEATLWLQAQLSRGAEVLIPEIADYELRRELIRSGLKESLAKLDRLESVLTYCPITTSVMHRAAQLWADRRNRHKPTSHPKALDGDVILAAQAEQLKAAIVTDNVGHLGDLAKVVDWRD